MYLPTENSLIFGNFKVVPIDLEEHAKQYKIAPPQLRKITTRLGRVEAADKHFANSPYLMTHTTEQEWRNSLFEHRGVLEHINEYLRHWPLEDNMFTKLAKRERFLHSCYRQMCHDLWGLGDVECLKDKTNNLIMIKL